MSGIRPPGPGLRLISAIVAAVSVGLAFTLPDLTWLYAGIATFHALCCLTPGAP